jgi:PTH1 family peptidyl-tRNA hydrolase
LEPPTGGKILLVGLGNPGIGYRLNRHNVGFMIISRLSKDYGIRLKYRRLRARFGEGSIEGLDCILARPSTYMNLSGHPVAGLMEYHGLEKDRLIVLHDDLDLPLGKVRTKDGGGHGGHNGLRSVIDVLGNGDFKRIKVGIGRPPGRMTAEEWVLQNFASDEREVISEGIHMAAAAAVDLIRSYN